MDAMADQTRIEWCDATFNPWTGCQHVSPACDHCYAEAQAKRAPKTFGGWGPHAERRRTSESYWRQPLLWNKRAAKEGRRLRVFCASMADVFDNQVPVEWREDLWALIHDTPHLDWLLLTKRPGNIRKMLPPAFMLMNAPWPWPNVWLGTTVENQAEADRRIPELLAVPARVRFLSCEPLLGAVDLTRARHPSGGWDNYLTGDRHRAQAIWSDSTGLAWVIAGGESGPHARPSHPDWSRSLRDQCAAAGVPFFFKQVGEWQHRPDWAHFREAVPEPWRRVPSAQEGVRPALMFRVGKKAAGVLLDGREHREWPA